MTQVPSAGARQAMREAVQRLPPSDAVDVHVGRRIRERRIALGISQGALGRHLGLTFSQVQKYEKGANRIGAGRLYQIAALLEVPVQYFFQGMDERGSASVPHARSQAAIAVRFREALDGIADPQARHALLTLAQSMVAEGRGKAGQ